MTGNSVAFVGESIPYNTYNLTNVINMAASLKRNGYDTLAFHPAVRTNYKRNSRIMII